jgi:hypothetical protein
MAASLVFGVLLVVITECLSLVGLFSTGGVLVAWLLVTVASVVVWKKVKRVEREWESFELTPFLKVLIASVLAFVIVTGLIAVIAPPNNWDSMTYHMARVAHWIQNGSVAHYPTNILRQLAMPPWAEFAIAHLQVMSGGDYLANLVQWFSMIGSVVGVSLIAKRLGASARAQVFSAVIAAAIPMGVVQASSTQNDYVLAFWLVGFVYYGLLWRERPGVCYALLAGASLALAILTKGTAYIYALPFLIWFAASVLRSHGSRALAQIVLIFVLVVILNSGHYIRNMGLFGSPVSSTGLKFSNEVFGPATLLSNLTRGLALYAATPSKDINRGVQSVVGSIHSTLGMDTHDPRTTWEGQTFYINRLTTHEDRSQSQLHLMLILLSIVLFLSSRRLRGPPELACYAGMLVLSFLFFCLYLKWQPWHTRLHLPLFVLWSPFIALLIVKAAPRSFANSVVVILLLAALPWLFFNELRPVLAGENIMNTSRVDQYFKYRPQIKEPYVKTVEAIMEGRCRDIGLKIGHEDWEYPFWVLLKRRGEAPVRIEHVRVENVSKIKALAPPFEEFKPCYLISW